MDDSETARSPDMIIQEPPIHCSWCLVKTEQSSMTRLVIRGANYCSRNCYLAENYEKFRNVAVFMILFTIFFPYMLFSLYPGDISPLLIHFTPFYIFSGLTFLILFVLAVKARSVRVIRPKTSRIGN